MDLNLFDLFTWAIGTLLAMAAFLFATYRHLMARISNGDAALHGKVEELREDVRDKYVRREDLGARFDPVKSTLNDHRVDMRQMNEKLDRLIQGGRDYPKRQNVVRSE